MRTLLKLAGCVLALVVVVAVGASFHPEVRNVYRALYPVASYDQTPPELPSDLAEPAVLLFTKTNGFRHRDAIEAGARFLEDLAQRRGWSLFQTENGAVFNAGSLPRFRVVVWNNASGAPLNQEQRAALQSWIEGGGSFVAIHGAVDKSNSSWEWYQREFVGATFIGHIIGPQFQEATLRVEQREHPATKHLGATWRHTEEWYSFDRSVRGQPGVEVLATVDESTYSPRLKMLWMDEDLAMGDHPILWTRTVGAGRAFFSALGHQGEAYQAPEYQGVLEGAIEWAGWLEESAESAESAEIVE